MARLRHILFYVPFVIAAGAMISFSVWEVAFTIRAIAQTSPAQTPKPSGGCDQTLWQHVYHPDRLTVKKPCFIVTGTIVDATDGKRKDGVRHEPDGDTHGWLKLDPGQEDLINAGNRKAEAGNLVFEVICQFPVRQKDATSACQGYKSQIVIPPVGSHVAITGSLIEDDEKAPKHYQWMEMHPVMKIEVIP